jgi:hypothetical protein
VCSRCGNKLRVFIDRILSTTFEPKIYERKYKRKSFTICIFGKYKNIHETFSTGFGVRYRPLIPNSLPASVHHVRECISGSHKFKTSHSSAEFVIQTPKSSKV